jgi:hypothetical protein
MTVARAASARGPQSERKLPKRREQLLLFNLVGLSTDPSAYDQFLIVVGLAFNRVTVWTAWNWV